LILLKKRKKKNKDKDKDLKDKRNFVIIDNSNNNIDLFSNIDKDEKVNKSINNSLRMLKNELDAINNNDRSEEIENFDRIINNNNIIQNKNNNVEEKVNIKSNKENQIKNNNKIFRYNFTNWINYYNCLSKNDRKKNFYIYAEEILRKNLDLIKYIHLINEYKTLKKILGKNLSEILTFVSKPSISLEKNKKNDEIITEYYSLNNLNSIKKYLLDLQKKNFENKDRDNSSFLDNSLYEILKLQLQEFQEN